MKGHWLNESDVKFLIRPKTFCLLHSAKWRSLLPASHLLLRLLAADSGQYLTTFDDGTCRCMICNTLFRCRSIAYVHFERAHQTPEFVECCLCKKVIKNKYNFRVHINLTHGIRGKQILEKYGQIVSQPYQWWCCFVVVVDYVLLFISYKYFLFMASFE